MNDRLTTPSRPRHGGDLDVALAQFGGQASEWLDLSTGISPWAYPIPEVNESVWRELPSSHHTLIKVAAHYYGCPRSAIFPTPGSQIAIRLIPNLIRSASRVGVPTIGYQEHAYSWKQSGHAVERYSSFDELKNLIDLGKIDNAVVINPNNPSCEFVSAKNLALISQSLSGILIIDEAFADLDSRQSLSQIQSIPAHLVPTHRRNTIVLRSLGKFFGLAGARIGFVVSHHALAQQLNALLCPWSINAAAQHIAEQALQDTHWQTMQKQRIQEHSQQLNGLIKTYIDGYSQTHYTHQSQGLFTTITGDAKHLELLHRNLAQQHIWTRIGDVTLDQNGAQLNWLRLSLPGDRFDQLATALTSLSR